MQDAPVAAIDLGTNTILMVVGQRTERGIQILADEHAVVRLGEGVDAQGYLSTEAIERTCRQMKVYADIAGPLGVRSIAAWGTSALRDAANRQTLIDRVFQDSQIELQPLSGEEEALLTFRGARWGLENLTNYAVIDIGGGSSEIAIGTPSKLQFSLSLNIGSVRLSERLFSQLPPTPHAQKRARTQVETALSGLPPMAADLPLLAVAGTALVLAALDAGESRFDAPSLDGYYLQTERVVQLSNNLLEMDYLSLSSLSPIGPERADIISAGALILSAFLEKCGLNGVSVSMRGLRYGLLANILQDKDASTAST